MRAEKVVRIRNERIGGGMSVAAVMRLGRLAVVGIRVLVLGIGMVRLARDPPVVGIHIRQLPAYQK
jgi:hypothetical protein